MALFRSPLPSSTSLPRIRGRRGPELPDPLASSIARRREETAPVRNQPFSSKWRRVFWPPHLRPPLLPKQVCLLNAGPTSTETLKVRRHPPPGASLLPSRVPPPRSPALRALSGPPSRTTAACSRLRPLLPPCLFVCPPANPPALLLYLTLPLHLLRLPPPLCFRPEPRSRGHRRFHNRGRGARAALRPGQQVSGFLCVGVGGSSLFGFLPAHAEQLYGPPMVFCSPLLFAALRSFMLDASQLGMPRASAAATLLGELNDGVVGSFVDEDPMQARWVASRDALDVP